MKKKGFPLHPFIKNKEERKRNKKQTNEQTKEYGFRRFFSDLDERKRRFWEKVCECARRHPEWPRDGVEDFFLYWTEESRDGQLKFEHLKTFGMGQRMNSYMKRRRWLNNFYENQLKKARGR